MRLRSFLTLAASTVIVGCSSSVDPVICTAVVVPAISVSITDSISGAWLAQQATAIAVDGSYSDTLRLYEGESQGPALVYRSRAGAYERPGTYQVRVIVPGYRAWEQRGVVVTRNACHVNEQRLTARLVRT